MEQWKDCLAALVPCYGEGGGNATLIYTAAGEMVQDRRTLRWNLRRLARLYCVDLEAARRRHGSYLECRQGVPLPFSASLVLVPLKVREAVGKNDGACGYFSPAAVQDVVEAGEGKRSAVLLPGGHRIPCLFAPRTVKKRLKAGVFVLERFRREILPGGTAASGGTEALHPELRYFLERLVLAVLGGITEKGNRED